MRTMLRILSAATVLAAAPALASAQGAAAPAPAMAAGDIVETAVAAGQFTTLARALTAAGLVETLKGSGPFTVFAPTDAAFAKLPAGALDGLLADREKLRQVLLYHVVPGRVTASQVAGLTSAATAAGPAVRVSVMGGTPMIDNAHVVSADVAASNGVIHVIDTVLMPPAAGTPVRKDGH